MVPRSEDPCPSDSPETTERHMSLSSRVAQFNCRTIGHQFTLTARPANQDRDVSKYVGRVAFALANISQQ